MVEWFDVIAKLFRKDIDQGWVYVTYEYYMIRYAEN